MTQAEKEKFEKDTGSFWSNLGDGISDWWSGRLDSMGTCWDAVGMMWDETSNDFQNGAWVAGIGNGVLATLDTLGTATVGTLSLGYIADAAEAIVDNGEVVYDADGHADYQGMGFIGEMAQALDNVEYDIDIAIEDGDISAANKAGGKLVGAEAAVVVAAAVTVATAGAAGGAIAGGSTVAAGTAGAGLSTGTKVGIAAGIMAVSTNVMTPTLNKYVEIGGEQVDIEDAMNSKEDLEDLLNKQYDQLVVNGLYTRQEADRMVALSSGYAMGEIRERDFYKAYSEIEGKALYGLSGDDLDTYVKAVCAYSRDNDSEKFAKTIADELSDYCDKDGNLVIKNLESVNDKTDTIAIDNSQVSSEKSDSDDLTIGDAVDRFKDADEKFGDGFKSFMLAVNAKILDACPAFAKVEAFVAKGVMLKYGLGDDVYKNMDVDSLTSKIVELSDDAQEERNALKDSEILANSGSENSISEDVDYAIV